MKRILSISLGSSSRDHTVRWEFAGESFEIERRGTNGDLDEAVSLYKRYDGSVDAFGVGGTGFYVDVDGIQYQFRDALKLRRAVTRSKVADGSLVKGLLERRAFLSLEAELNRRNLTLNGARGLQTSGVERFEMAKVMTEHGMDMVWGDLMFALGVPFPLRSLRALKMTARALMPIVGRLPFQWIYPLGREQDAEPERRWGKYYDDALVIAGDYLQIRQHLPGDLTGKIIVTNTTTAKDVADLRARNLHMLVTVTPRMSGRSFGTNMIEAVLLSLISKPQTHITRQDLLDQIERLSLHPHIETMESVGNP